MVEEPVSEVEAAALKRMQSIIDMAPQRIEEEMETTDNSWIASYANKIGALSLCLHLFLGKEPAAAPRFDEVKEKLSALDVRWKELAREYSDPNTPFPDEIKQELLESLDVLKNTNAIS